MRTRRRLTLRELASPGLAGIALLLAVASAAPLCAQQPQPQPEQEPSERSAPAEAAPLDFARDVLPIFETYCVGCHTSGDAQGDLVMDSFADLMQGGSRGAAITPGQSASSRLFLMAAGLAEPVMPPDDVEGPSEDELALLRRWIDEGAAGPAGEDPVRRTLRTPKIEPLTDHPLPISALALSPDGTQLAIARFATVEIVDPRDQTVLLELPEQPGAVNDLRFTADGSRLVVASGVAGLYGQAAIFDAATGDRAAEVAGHRDTLYAAALSPDGTMLATAGYDHEVNLWEVSSGQRLRTLSGHNGAIFDVAFSVDGGVLATASADETVKLWKVENGERLATLSEPQGEVWTVAFTPDGNRIVAGSADNRFRVWQFESRQTPRSNPLLQTRFADETPLVQLAFTPDGSRMIVASQAGKLSVFETREWSKVGNLPQATDAVTEVAVSASGDRAAVASMDGRLQWIDLAPSETDLGAQPAAALREVFLQLGPPQEIDETPEFHADAASAMPLPRGAIVRGTIETNGEGETDADSVGEDDWFRFDARRGEVWMVETRAAQDSSPLDSIVEVRDSSGEPLLRTRLQAVRDSYFTFRGKDSNQSNDFRMFAWEEMELDEYLYSAGEVTRLWMYPRGPDSGFNVYPGRGNRWTYFDTTPITHALQEPAYIVRQLQPGEPPAANGLPVFDIHYVNDDDASRQIGRDSRLRFTAPADGQYTIRLRDTRGMGGEDFRYQLILRPADPDFLPAVDKVTQPIPAGAGREFRVSIVRRDGYDGPVQFEVSGLADGLHATESVVVEAGQNEAYGVIWSDADMPAEQTFAPPTVVARAEILGRTIERPAGDLGELKTAPPPQVSVQVEGGPSSASERVVIRPGETVTAVVRIDRNGNDGEIKLGNEFAGRNMPHGVFVDNIGLNGLMVLKGANEQQFFITASPIAAPGVRLFHLVAEVDGGVASRPIELEVRSP